MLAYRRQDAGMTLAEGFAEYYAAHPFLKRGEDLTAEAADFFRRHDAVHVVYGCDTSMPHESIVKLSSFFGTTGGFGVMVDYRLHDSRDIYRTLRPGDIARTIALTPFLAPRTLWRCARQKARWPWAGFEAHLDEPLAALRRRYGIRVA